MRIEMVPAVAELARTWTSIWIYQECETYREDVEGALAADQPDVAIVAARGALQAAADAFVLARTGAHPRDGFSITAAAGLDPEIGAALLHLWSLPDRSAASAYVDQAWALIDRMQAELPITPPKGFEEMLRLAGLARAFIEAGETLGADIVDQEEMLHL